MSVVPTYTQEIDIKKWFSSHGSLGSHFLKSENPWFYYHATLYTTKTTKTTKESNKYNKKEKGIYDIYNNI